MPLPTAEERELLEVNQRLLTAIMAGDWTTYAELCHPSLTCFEPEAVGHLVEGLEFHQFYFRQDGKGGPQPQVTMSRPHVRMMGDSAVLAYVRLTQVATPNGPVTKAVEETRIWQKLGGQWQHVHFHRTPLATT